MIPPAGFYYAWFFIRRPTHSGPYHSYDRPCQHLYPHCDADGMLYIPHVWRVKSGVCHRRGGPAGVGSGNV